MRSNVYLIGNKLIEINESLKNELIDLNILNEPVLRELFPHWSTAVYSCPCHLS